MAPVRLGIIGCGVMGRVHVTHATSSPDIEVAAVADLREKRAAALAEEFGVPRVHADGDALIDDPEIDAVVLALQTNLRTYLALRAFARGKHVLTEKPVAMSAVEVERLIEARGDLVAACCSSRFRFYPSAQAITDFIATGALGGLRVIRCRAIGPPGQRTEGQRPFWRVSRSSNAGGILVNWGCYDLDYLLGVTGWSLQPSMALASTWGVAPHFDWYVAPGSDAETHVAALISFDGGATLTYERAEAATATRDEAWEITGSEGTLHMKMTGGQAKTVTHDYADPEKGVVSETIWEGDEKPGSEHEGPVHDFAQAILTGTPPKTTLEQSLAVQKISDAIYLSADEGVAVDIL